MLWLKRKLALKVKFFFFALIDNEIFKTLIEDYNIKDTNDIKDMLKDLLSGTIQTMLEAEIEHELGYAKHSLREWQSR